MYVITPETQVLKYLVRKERLELSRVTPQEPKSSASTNSATLALNSRSSNIPPAVCRYKHHAIAVITKQPRDSSVIQENYNKQRKTLMPLNLVDTS